MSTATKTETTTQSAIKMHRSLCVGPLQLSEAGDGEHIVLTIVEPSRVTLSYDEWRELSDHVSYSFRWRHLEELAEKTRQAQVRSVVPTKPGPREAGILTHPSDEAQPPIEPAGDAGDEPEPGTRGRS